MRVGVHWIYSRDMESIALTLKRWGLQLLFMRDGVHIYSRGLESTGFIHEIWSPQHGLIRDGVHSIYYWEIENTTFIHKRWSSMQLLMRDRVHSIYSREMEWVEWNCPSFKVAEGGIKPRSILLTVRCSPIESTCPTIIIPHQRYSPLFLHQNLYLIKWNQIFFLNINTD